jgi:microcystin-dependent protein
MADKFLSEIRIMSFVYAPRGWALCNGQLLPINQNQALFSLLGTTYGGDGRTNFALPDLRARVPIHAGSGHTLGEKAGESAHTLTLNEMPQHLHSLAASSLNANQAGGASGNSWAQSAQNPYETSSDSAMAAGMLTNTGGSQAHENTQPYLTLSFCIALQGIFPSPN